MVDFEKPARNHLLVVGTGSVESRRLQAAWANSRHIPGGAEGDRTPDLVIANDALSQLSYGPVPGDCCLRWFPQSERAP
jgi:hypothetical protein